MAGRYQYERVSHSHIGMGKMSYCGNQTCQHWEIYKQVILGQSHGGWAQRLRPKAEVEMCLLWMRQQAVPTVN